MQRTDARRARGRGYRISANAKTEERKCQKPPDLGPSCTAKLLGSTTPMNAASRLCADLLWTDGARRWRTGRSLGVSAERGLQSREGHRADDAAGDRGVAGSEFRLRRSRAPTVCVGARSARVDRTAGAERFLRSSGVLADRAVGLRLCPLHELEQHLDEITEEVVWDRFGVGELRESEANAELAQDSREILGRHR
jgi:hypothetical protein